MAERFISTYVEKINKARRAIICRFISTCVKKMHSFESKYLELAVHLHVRRENRGNRLAGAHIIGSLIINWYLIQVER